MVDLKLLSNYLKSMPEITFITFNYGNAGAVFNGPGVSLFNLVKELRKNNIKINVFSELKSQITGCGTLSDHIDLIGSIKKSDVVHHWSGISEKYVNILKHAKNYQKKIISGPNAIDSTKVKEENVYIQAINPDLYLTVNHHLKYKLSSLYKIQPNKFKIFMVGPGNEWSPIKEDDGRILWKGNSTQYVKDINFALEIQKRLSKYDFCFLGYPKPYDYFQHINDAKKCHIYFSSSLSETMGMTLLESWASGLPSVTHPKIYLHGLNYQTGIITNRDLESYCEAITEIMENQQLYQDLKRGAINYVKSFENLTEKYLDILEWK